MMKAPLNDAKIKERIWKIDHEQQIAVKVGDTMWQICIKMHLHIPIVHKDGFQYC